MHGGSSWATPNPLDFSDNLNPLGPPRALLDLIAEAVERGVHLWFPAHLAEETLSQYEGVEVTAFNGATEALLAVLVSLRPKRLLLPWPTYGDYERIGRHIGVDVVKGPLSSLVETAGNGDVLILCNPNNPTGDLMRRDELLDLDRALRARGAYLVVDESFIDFVKAESAAPDVLVVKSYGKILAVPGLRIGAALGRIKGEVKAPWRLNSVADYALFHLGSDALKRHREATRAYVASEAPRVMSRLAACAEVHSSVLHFFVAKLSAEPRVKVRPLDDLGMRGYYRISIKDREKNEVLIKSICAASER